jgi:uncharacterized protein (DUF2236 family)
MWSPAQPHQAKRIANGPELLNWVQGTAAYGFLQAYHTYVRPLFASERDRYYAEGAPRGSGESLQVSEARPPVAAACAESPRAWRAG